MSRARNIKPGFFKNDLLAECSPLARILFAGLWCEADREGRLEDRPKRLKADILPYDDCDLDALLGELASRGFIVRYVVDGAGYIAIPEFKKHQNPHVKEAASSIPAQDKPGASPVQASEVPERAGLIPDSLLLIPDSPSLSVKPRTPPGARTFLGWIESLPEGQDPIPEDDPVFAYAAKVGLPEDFVALAWAWFDSTYGPDGGRSTKRYADWRKVFRNAVEGNWAKAWFAEGGGYRLTTVGQQLQRSLREAK